MPEHFPPVILSTVPVNDAIQYAHNWREYLRPQVPADALLRGFLMPIGDIYDLSQLRDVLGVRCYLCIFPGRMTRHRYKRCCW